MGVFVVFAYGSLMYEPELPGALVDRIPARLGGVHRWFNKRSHTRGCPPDYAPDRAAVADFHEDGHRVSLVLGTRNGGHIDGMALMYPEAAQAELMQRLRVREGDGYTPRAVTVAAREREWPAVAWLTDPRSARVVDVDLAMQAEVLLAATPRTDVDGRARGANYLFGVLRSLAALDVWDPRMEALGELVRRGVACAGAQGYS